MSVYTYAGSVLRVLVVGGYGFGALCVGRGKDARVWDTEGREFIDFSIGWGSVLVGHAREEVVEAVQKQVQTSNDNSSSSRNHAVFLTNTLCSSGCARLQLCVHQRAGAGAGRAHCRSKPSSGAAPLLCIWHRGHNVRTCVCFFFFQIKVWLAFCWKDRYCQRLARAFTGRTKILKFEVRGPSLLAGKLAYSHHHPLFPIRARTMEPMRLESRLCSPRSCWTTPRQVQLASAAESAHMWSSSFLTGGCVCILATPPPPPTAPPDPSSAGIAHAVLDHVLVAPYNDAETTKAIIEEYGPQCMHVQGVCCLCLLTSISFTCAQTQGRACSHHCGASASLHTSHGWFLACPACCSNRSGCTSHL